MADPIQPVLQHGPIRRPSWRHIEQSSYGVAGATMPLLQPLINVSDMQCRNTGAPHKIKKTRQWYNLSHFQIVDILNVSTERLWSPALVSPAPHSEVGRRGDWSAPHFRPASQFKPRLTPNYVDHNAIMRLFVAPRPSWTHTRTFYFAPTPTPLASMPMRFASNYRALGRGRMAWRKSVATSTQSFGLPSTGDKTIDE